MSSDNHINSRRWFLTGALGTCLAAAGGATWYVLTAQPEAADTARPVDGAPAPGGPSAAAAAGSAPPAPTGAPAPPRSGTAERAANRQDAYRLRPIAGDGSMGAPAARPEVRTRAETTLPGASRSVALTFDDGPHPTYTPKVLDLLRRHGVQATFFVIGENAAAFPHLLKDIAAGGHVVANHSYTHPQLTRLSRAKVADELGRTSDVISRTLGSPPRWARAPYGDWDTSSLRICARLGMEPLGWSIDTNDWARPGVDRITRTVTGGIRPGSIILQHDGGGERSQTVRAVDAYLPRLIDEGYTFVRPHV